MGNRLFDIKKAKPKQEKQGWFGFCKDEINMLRFSDVCNKNKMNVSLLAPLQQLMKKITTEMNKSIEDNNKVSSFFNLQKKKKKNGKTDFFFLDLHESRTKRYC